MSSTPAVSSEPTSEFPYRIENKVGEGGMGTVCRATETPLNRVVAVRMRKRKSTGRLGPGQRPGAGRLAARRLLDSQPSP